MSVTSRLLKEFVKQAGDKLSGEWVVIGGSVISLSGAEYRVTNDIDLAGPDSATQKDTLLLMGIAENLGLPVEAINQAGAFFLKKIPYWKKRLVAIHKGKKATFYRPDTTLYLILKIPRLSETDLTDCLKMLEIYPEELETSLVKKKIAKELSNASGERLQRLRQLQKRL